MKNIKLVPKILTITILLFLVLNLNSLQLKANEIFQQRYKYNQTIGANKTASLVTVFLKKGNIINTTIQIKDNTALKLQVPIKNSSGIYSHIINFVDSNTNSYTIKEDGTYTFCIYNPNTNKEVEYQLVVSINNISSTAREEQQDVQILEEIEFDKFSSKNEVWYGPFDLKQNDLVQSKFLWIGEQSLAVSVVKDDPSKQNTTLASKIPLIQNNIQDILIINEDGQYYFILSSTSNEDINTVVYLKDINGYFAIK